ncbi:protein-ADP-ribose hydrolase [Eubacteriaceae bacterium ES2]|nr:protein-ADP-ribose hydrolase [Eubacteriaceae bacterium ES2]
MTQDERLTYLIKSLLAESKELPEINTKTIAAPVVLRSLMNRRMPNAISEEFVLVQDAYLQEESVRKGIVGLTEIPVINEELEIDYPYGDKIAIWQGDITRLKVDAIVNAANSQMLGCFVPNHGCIDNAIHSAAGIQLRNACFDYMKKKRMTIPEYEEPTGQAMITDGFNLPSKHVIHTVGPIVYGTLTDKNKKDLAACYASILEESLINKIKSLAFCCISTGEFCFPNEEAARIAIGVVKTYMDQWHDRFDKIIFNVFIDNDLNIYKKLLKS